MSDPTFNESRNFFEFLSSKDFGEYSNDDATEFLKNKIKTQGALYFVTKSQKGIESFDNINNTQKALIFPLEKESDLFEYEVLDLGTIGTKTGDKLSIFNIISKDILTSDNTIGTSDSIATVINGLISKLDKTEKNRQIQLYNEALVELENGTGLNNLTGLIGVKETTETIVDSEEVEKLRNQIKNLELNAIKIQGQVTALGIINKELEDEEQKLRNALTENNPENLIDFLGERMPGKLDFEDKYVLKQLN